MTRSARDIQTSAVERMIDVCRQAHARRPVGEPVRFGDDPTGWDPGTILNRGGTQVLVRKAMRRDDVHTYGTGKPVGVQAVSDVKSFPLDGTHGRDAVAAPGLAETAVSVRNT